MWPGVSCQRASLLTRCMCQYRKVTQHTYLPSCAVYMRPRYSAPVNSVNRSKYNIYFYYIHIYLRIYFVIICTRGITSISTDIHCTLFLRKWIEKMMFYNVFLCHFMCSNICGLSIFLKRICCSYTEKWEIIKYLNLHLIIKCNLCVE